MASPRSVGTRRKVIFVSALAPSASLRPLLQGSELIREEGSYRLGCEPKGHRTCQPLSVQCFTLRTRCFLHVTIMSL